MSNENIDVMRELADLESERQKGNEAITNRRNRYAEMLMGEMGKDIDDVLSGKVKVKLRFKDKVKYKVRGFIQSITKYF